MLNNNDIDLRNFRFQLTLLREGGKFLLGTNATGGQLTLMMDLFSSFSTTAQKMENSYHVCKCESVYSLLFREELEKFQASNYSIHRAGPFPKINKLAKLGRCDSWCKQI